MSTRPGRGHATNLSNMDEYARVGRPQYTDMDETRPPAHRRRDTDLLPGPVRVRNRGQLGCRSSTACSAPRIVVALMPQLHTYDRYGPGTMSDTVKIATQPAQQYLHRS